MQMAFQLSAPTWACWRSVCTEPGLGREVLLPKFAEPVVKVRRANTLAL
jgi:hypothetical protein